METYVLTINIIFFIEYNVISNASPNKRSFNCRGPGRVGGGLNAMVKEKLEGCAEGFAEGFVEMLAEMFAERFAEVPVCRLVWFRWYANQYPKSMQQFISMSWKTKLSGHQHLSK